MTQHTQDLLFAAPCETDVPGNTSAFAPFPAADAFVALASSDVIPAPAPQLSDATPTAAAGSSVGGSSLAKEVKAVVAAVGSFMDI
jgi:hypothetical protein